MKKSATKLALLVFIFQFFILKNLFSSPPNIEWQKCLGGNYHDYAYSIQQTKDGGYIVAGYTESDEGDVISNHRFGYYDFWIVKLDSNGGIQWQKCLGGRGFDEAFSIQQTEDGGYIVAGCTSSKDGDVSGNHGNGDAWVVKLDSGGGIQWQKCLGGSSSDYAYSIEQTKDGGYIVAGHTYSNDGDVNGNHGNGSSTDAWVVKLDSNGDIQWQMCLGGTSDDYVYSNRQTKDGGYIVGGYTRSTDEDVSGYHGKEDFWVAKLDSDGDIRWQKSLGGSNDDKAYSIEQTKDGEYIVVGRTYSNDGDVIGMHDDYNYECDAWVVKLDPSGIIQWQKCLGGSNIDRVYSIYQTKDGGYIVAGHTYSNDGDVNGNHGDSDAWVVKLDSNGAIQWQKCLGGSNFEEALSIEQTKDGGYIVAGRTYSNDGDVSGNHDNSIDFWVVKLSPETTEVEETEKSDVFSISPNPATDFIEMFVGAGSKPDQIRIFNVFGQDLPPRLTSSATPQEGNLKIDVSALPGGVYFVRVGEKVMKFLKV